MKRFLLLIILFTFFVSSCQKDPSTFPAKVQFSFGMTSFESQSNLKFALSSNPPNSNNLLKIDDGTLVISKIDFEGRRQNVKDVFFTANFDPPIVIDLKEETASRQVQFDIPQGVYERIEMVFYLGAPGYLPFSMTGQANHPAFGGRLLRFEYPYSEPVRVRAKGQTGSEVVLRKDVVSQATLLVDAGFLFRLVNTGLLVSAETLNEGGREVILIAREKNTPIFNVIANRLSQSFEVIFD